MKYLYCFLPTEITIFVLKRIVKSVLDFFLSSVPEIIFPQGKKSGLTLKRVQKRVKCGLFLSIATLPKGKKGGNIYVGHAIAKCYKYGKIESVSKNFF